MSVTAQLPSVIIVLMVVSVTVVIGAGSMVAVRGMLDRRGIPHLSRVQLREAGLERPQVGGGHPPGSLLPHGCLPQPSHGCPWRSATITCCLINAHRHICACPCTQSSMHQSLPHMCDTWLQVWTTCDQSMSACTRWTLCSASGSSQHPT